MEGNGEQFCYDYDLGKLQLVSPPGRDFRMLVTPRFAPVYGEGEWERFSSQLLLNLCRRAGLFVDVGAHYGHYTLLVAKAFPACRVISLEPVPENFAVLERNVALNGLENVELRNLAASDGEGLKKLKVAEASDSCSFHEHPLVRTLREIEVRTVSLDDLLGTLPTTPTVIKLDTDGHEPYVLRGMRGLLESDAEVSLLVEFNPKCLRRAGYRPERFLEELFDLGFEVYAVDERNRLTYKLTEKSPKRWSDYLPEGDEMAYSNLLCLRREKSLSVCFFSHSSQLAGAERSLLELVEELVEDHGALCTVVLREDGPLQEMLEQAGASTVKAGYFWWWHREDMSPGEKRAMYTRSVSETLHHLGRTLKKINPDVIATFTTTIPWGAIAAAFLGKPHVWFIREVYDLGQPLRAALPLDEALDFIERLSSAIVVNSHYVRKTLFAGRDSEKVLTVHTHIKIPPDALDGHEETCFQRKGAARLIIAGAAYELKGQEDAVLAVRELVREGRDVELVIMGYCDTEYGKSLQRMVEEEGLEEHVKFTGFVENPYPFIQQADMVLLCSRGEAFSRALIEGMLLEKPLIASRTGVIPDLIKEGFNGLLYTPGDHRRLAEHIAYLMDHLEEAERLAGNGYQYAMNAFSREEYGGRIYALLGKVKEETGREESPLEPVRDERALLRGLLDAATAGNPSLLAPLMELADSLVEREARIAELSSSLHAREGRIAQLEGQVAQLQAENAQLKYDLGVRVEQITELNIKTAALEDIIRQIEGRMVIRLAERYQRVVERLLPKGTGRRRCYELAMNGLRAVVSEGWKGLRRGRE